MVVGLEVRRSVSRVENVSKGEGWFWTRVQDSWAGRLRGLEMVAVSVLVAVKPGMESATVPVRTDPTLRVGVMVVDAVQE